MIINAINKIKRAKFFFKDMSLIKFDKYEPKTIPNTEIKVIDVRKNQSILTCVMSDKKPNSALQVMITKDVATACFILRPAKKTSAGTIINPPPAPTKPVSTPTTVPVINNKL